MSFLQGRKNIYSIISNSVINHIKDKYSINNKLLKDRDIGNVFFGIPNNSVSSTTILANCSNDDGNTDCINCMLSNGVTSTMLDGDNYNKKENLNIINKVRKTQCFGVCSCKVTNINLSTNLIFATGVNINGKNLDISKITDEVKINMTNVNKTITSSDSDSSLYALLGAGAGCMLGVTCIGAAVFAGIFAATNASYTNDIDEQIKKVVSNISILYANAINQLITSSQELVIKGTGVKIHNISMKSIQDIVMSASQENCGNGNCVIDSIDSITNSLMSKLTNNVSSQISGMFSYAFNKNKNLIIGASIFIAVTLMLWFFLLFKKALMKKN